MCILSGTKNYQLFLEIQYAYKTLAKKTATTSLAHEAPLISLAAPFLYKNCQFSVKRFVLQ